MYVYLAQCFTGAHCYGVYSTEEDAKLAIQILAAKLTNYIDIHLDMQWVDTFGNGVQLDWVAIAHDPTGVDKGPCGVLGLMENPRICRVKLGAQLSLL